MHESILKDSSDLNRKSQAGGAAWLSEETSDLGGESVGLGAFTKFWISFHTALCAVEAKFFVLFRDTEANGNFQNHP